MGTGTWTLFNLLWQKGAGKKKNLLLLWFLRYGTFKIRYQKKWSSCLPFRPQSEFAECNQCFDIKQEIKGEKAGDESSAQILTDVATRKLSAC